MHLPFLQVPDDVWPKARTLARILRVPEFQGIGLAVALDAWALQCATDGDVSGLIDDPNPAEAIALAVGWEGDAAVLFAALVRVRLVEESSDGARVTTLEKYAAAVARPRKRSDAASMAANERWRRKKDAERMGLASSSHGDALRPDAESMRSDAKMQSKTQMQTEMKIEPSSASQAAGAADAGEDLPDATADAVEVPERPALELLPCPPDVPEAKPTGPNPEALRRLWNRHAEARGLSQWVGMSKAREGACRASLAAVPDLDRWEAWLAHELERPFNLGRNDTGWRADVDWLLRAKTRDLVADFNPATAPKSPPSAAPAKPTKFIEM